MTEDSSKTETALVLDGLAGGVDHLESIVVFLLIGAVPYTAWVRPGSDLQPVRVANAMRGLYLAAEDSLRAFEREARLPDGPLVTLESESHVILVQRVNTFGVACTFAQEVPLGFARMATRRIMATLEQDLPYPQEAARAELLIHARATVASAMPSPAELDFGAQDRSPETTAPRASIGDRVRALVSHLEAVAIDPHVVRVRVALRSGLGLEALVHPDGLNSDAVVLIETAAEDILDLERGKLAEMAEP